MAINRGHSNLPRYYEGNADPVFCKQAPAQSVALYLTNRDIWSNLLEVHENRRKTGREVSLLPECGAEPMPEANRDYEPAHHGVIEGVVRVNPWLYPVTSTVYVEVTARHSYERSVYDGFDCAANEAVFMQRQQIHPRHSYDREGPASLKQVPKDLTTYSLRTRRLYNKLGGPIGGQANMDENVTSIGVYLGQANYSRKDRTCVPQTKAAEPSGYPDHPYVTFNIPFRFDINGAPDSIRLKHFPDTSDRPPHSELPPTRMKLFYDAVYGFANHYPESDSEEQNSDTQEERLLNPVIHQVDRDRMRHPGDPKPDLTRTARKVSRRQHKLQSELDLFHKDSYQWTLRPKRAPADGVTWTIRVYVSDFNGAKISHLHTAKLSFRKLSYLPKWITLDNAPTPVATYDYSLSLGPTTGRDAGLLTLVGKLDKLIYSPGDLIECSIKLHNSSVRVLNRIIVDLYQCIRVRALGNRTWRTVVCRKELTDESLLQGLPILPGSENLRYRVVLDPWANKPKLMEDQLSGRQSSETGYLAGQPGCEYAFQGKSRYRLVPPDYKKFRSLAMSSMVGGLEEFDAIKTRIECENFHIGQAPENENEDAFATEDGEWLGNPHAKCRCHTHDRKGAPDRTERMPPDEPYQAHMENKTVYPPDPEAIDQPADEALIPYCPRCHSNKFPVNVFYEVSVKAQLMRQGRKDELAGDYPLVKVGLAPELYGEGKHQLIGLDGPKVILPCWLMFRKPTPEVRVPIANHHVDMRQDCLGHLEVPAMKDTPLHEPSFGRGFLKPNLPPIASCALEKLSN